MLFSQLQHPFVWTTPAERKDVLANANEPLWHRFLGEADRHFADLQHLPQTKFPAFCHDGDFDEVMAVAVLAYVRDDARLWNWVADWLRGALGYYRKIVPEWRENECRILRGEPPPGGGNPRQFFQGFTRGGMYWVEAGLMSVFLHLLDLLEAHASEALSVGEKAGLLEAVADYARRYAFHEEAFKYNNRGMWANAGLLLAAISHSNPKTGELLRFQAARRNDEFRSTFLDDGFHAEGAPDYHLMAADAILAYSLTASHLDPAADVFAARDGLGFFQKYPSFLEIVRAYLRTVEPGPVPWNHPRGCSVSQAVTVRPSLVQAWKLSGDPEIGWLLRERMADTRSNVSSPLRVTNTALLGLGHYQPLLNFWLFRPIEKAHLPRKLYDVLPSYGGVFSRSGWDEKAECVTARFGFEGTGKGHRDHAHVTATIGGIRVLTDPFPRFGPPGLDSSVFHNTVTLDEREPDAVIGTLQAEASEDGLKAFLISNAGGVLPDRSFLHDPREETNYWFTNHPEPAAFDFQRAILHVPHSGVVIVDRIAAAQPVKIDWFFHSALSPANYDPMAAPRYADYQLKQRNVVSVAQRLQVPLRGEAFNVSSGQWHTTRLGDASLKLFSPDASLTIELGHWSHAEECSAGGITFSGEVDYFLRARAQAGNAVGVWVLEWPDASLAPEISQTGDECLLKLPTCEWRVDFRAAQMSITL